MITCKYHPEREALKRLISWIETSKIHAYPVDHGPRCQPCLEEAMRRMPFSASWQFLTQPLPASY